MKKIFYYLSVAAALCLVGCDNGDEITPAPQTTGPGVSFGATATAPIALDTEKGEITVPVYRMDAAGALTVPVSFSAEDEGIFTFPLSVVFADGQDEVNLVIPVDVEAMEYNISYPFSATIGDETMTTVYGSSVLQTSTIRPLTWTSIGKLQWVSTIMWDIADDETLAVDKADQADIFRVPTFVKKDYGFMFEIDFEANTVALLDIYDTGILDGDGARIGIIAQTGTYDPATRTITFAQDGRNNYYVYDDNGTWKPGWYLDEVFVLPEY